MTSPLVVALGRREAGDDAFGALVLEALDARDVPVDTLLLRPDPGDLTAALRGRERVVIFDACRSGAAPGTIRRFDLNIDAVPERVASAHGLTLGQAIGLVRLLEGLPKHCHLVVAEGAGFDIGTEPSPAITAAAGQVAEELADLLDAAPERV